MNKEFTLIEGFSGDKWDNFVENSINGSIFSHSSYLDAANINYKLFYCYKKQELRAAIVVIESTFGDDIIQNDFVIYSGVIFNKPTNNQNSSQQLSEQFKINSFFASNLASLYNKIQLSLHPSIIDVRPFLWFNYGEKKPQYNTRIRYTTYVDISDFDRSIPIEQIKLFNKASVSRRQQIRYAIKKGYRTDLTNDSLIFIKFYQNTMSRQNIIVEEDFLKNMQILIDKLLELKKAKIFSCFDDKNELASMPFIGWDTKRAYYIFGANDPNKRNGHSGTAVLWDAFYHLNEIGIKTVDLEGVNSPNRGWFKLSFGGNIIPYYELIYKK